MKTRHIIGISVLSSLLTVATILALLLSSGAVTAQNPEPGSAGSVAAQSPEWLVPASEEVPPAARVEEASITAAATDYLHVSGSVFVPLWDTTTASYEGSGCKSLSGTNLYLNYGLALPYDSTVTQLRLYYKDTSPSNGTLWLARYDDGLGYTYLVTLTTSGTAGWGTSTASLNSQLDYDNYSYTLVWSAAGVAGSTMQFCGFRVAYSRPLFGAAALPLVMRGP